MRPALTYTYFCYFQNAGCTLSRNVGLNPRQSQSPALPSDQFLPYKSDNLQSSAGPMSLFEGACPNFL